MKTIGLIGGMSWESTVTYYQLINDYVKDHLGGLHSAKLLLYSVDFEEIERWQASGDWDKSAQRLTDIAKKLEGAGADFIVICTNTMHKVVPQMEKALSIPILHIADATADVLLEAGIRTVGLLGTKYTMTQNFYRSRLEQWGLSVVIPDGAGVEKVNDVIYHELCLGIIREESRAYYRQVIGQLKAKGAQGVILGCTEIGLLISQEDSSLPVFDTTRIHGEAAARKAIEA